MSNDSTAMTIIDDGEASLGRLMNPGTISTAIQAMSVMADKRITTARMFPRSVAKFKKETTALLREDVETARTAEYAKPIGGGVVRGPSIRLAELAAMCWTNLEVEVYEPVVGDKSVIVKASAWDLERNYRQEGMATTPIIDKHGRRYPQHQIETACAATASKAKRNAIIAVIPRSYIQDLLAVAREVANGNAKPLEQQRFEALDHFARAYKVQPPQVFEFLQVEGFDDIGEDELDLLRGVVTAIKEGSAQVADYFATPKQSKAEEVKSKLDARKQKATARDIANRPTPEEPAKPTGKPPATTSATSPPTPVEPTPPGNGKLFNDPGASNLPG